MSAGFCCCFPVFAAVLYFNYPPSVSLLCVARSGEPGVYVSPGLKLNRRTVTHQHSHPSQMTADAQSRALQCATCSEPPAPAPNMSHPPRSHSHTQRELKGAEEEQNAGDEFDNKTSVATMMPRGELSRQKKHGCAPTRRGSHR